VAYKTSIQTKEYRRVMARQCVVYRGVKSNTTEWREIVTAELQGAMRSGEVNLWSIVFKTGVSAVSISRQQN